MKKPRHTVSLDSDIEELLEAACRDSRLTPPAEIARIVSLYLQGKLVEARGISFIHPVVSQVENVKEDVKQASVSYDNIDFDMEIEEID